MALASRHFSVALVFLPILCGYQVSLRELLRFFFILSATFSLMFNRGNYVELKVSEYTAIG
jgi:hypothetical protein